MLQTVNGTRLNVIDEGAGDPIVFVHSNGSSWRNWIPQLDALTDSYRCIAVDLRGYGQSDRQGPFTVDQYAADIAGLCATLGLEHVHLVGISLGGLIAQAVAISHPALIDRLVLASATSGSDPALVERVRRAAATIRSEGLGPVLEANIDATWSAQVHESEPHVVRNFRREFSSNDPHTLAGTLESVAVHDHRDRLGSIRARTLVLYGALDGLTTHADVTGLVEAIPDAELVVLSDAGHLCNMERPEEFNAALRSFLDHQSGRG